MPKQLDHPFPSSPSRPPKYHISFSHGEKLLQSVGFGALYSARIYIATAIGKNEIKWRGDDSFFVEDIGLTVKGDGLEDIMEHELSKTEEAWELPDPYLGDATAIATGERRKVRRTALDSEGEDVKEKTKTKEPKEPKASKKPRASADGLTTLSEICAAIGIEPRDARAILRKSNTAKPDAGWAWSAKEATSIKQLLSGKDKDNGGDKTPTAKARTSDKEPAPTKEKRKTRR